MKEENVVDNWTAIVVEDTYDDGELISTILSVSGVRVYRARNGFECLQLVQKLDPTLIITDLAMPDMDGWEMLNALRANPHTETVPVIAISAYYSSKLADDAIRAGFKAFFPKPVSPRDFVQRLQELVN